MRARRPVAACVAALVLAGLAGPADARKKTRGEEGSEPASIAAPALRVEPGDRGTRVEVAVPGRIVAWTFARSPAGHRVVLLVDRASHAETETKPPEDEPGAPKPMPPCPDEGNNTGPMEVFAFDAAAPEDVVRIAGAPPDAHDVDVADLDGDGADEILVRARGRMLLLGPGGDSSTLFRDDALAHGAVQPRAVSTPSVAGVPMFAVPKWGAIELVAERADGTWGSVARAELPLEGRAGASSLDVRTLATELVGRATDGRWVLATRPEQVDDLRLRVRLVTLDPGGESSVADCWARLPGAEEMVEWSFLLVDDRPVLVAVTKPADKLSLFADRGLRLYLLERDRSRLGRLPFLATQTAANLIQETKPLLADVDGDGTEDLVIAYYKGLIGSEVALEVFMRRRGLAFDDRRRTTSFGVKDPDESFLAFGQDLDGDGVGDLAVRSRDRYLVYPGRRSEDGRKLVSRDAIEIPSAARGEVTEEVWISAEGRAGVNRRADVDDAVVDLDGNGVAEIVAIDPGGGGKPGRFTFARATAPPPDTH